MLAVAGQDEVAEEAERRLPVVRLLRQMREEPARLRRPGHHRAVQPGEQRVVAVHGTHVEERLGVEQRVRLGLVDPAAEVRSPCGHRNPPPGIARHHVSRAARVAARLEPGDDALRQRREVRLVLVGVRVVQEQGGVLV